MNELTSSQQPELHSRRTYGEITAGLVKDKFPKDQEFSNSVVRSGRRVWDKVQEGLRSYNLTDQREFLSDLCKILNVPNYQELGEYLAMVNNIPWFSPIEGVNNIQLKDAVSKCLISLNYPIKNPAIRIVWITHGDWRQARYISRDRDTQREKWESAIHQARIALSITSPVMVGDIARSITFNRLKTIVHSMNEGPEFAGAGPAIEYASFGAQWIAAHKSESPREDTPDNPFRNLIELYAMGYWPIGMRNRIPFFNLKPEFIIAIPQS